MIAILTAYWTHAAAFTLGLLTGCIFAATPRSKS